MTSVTSRDFRVGQRDYTGKVKREAELSKEEAARVATEEKEAANARLAALEARVVALEQLAERQGVWLERLLDAVSGSADGSVTGLWSTVFGSNDADNGGLVAEVAGLLKARAAPKPDPKSARPSVLNTKRPS